MIVLYQTLVCAHFCYSTKYTVIKVQHNVISYCDGSAF